MRKRANSLLRANKEPYRIPRRVQDLIPIRRIWEDGVFQVGQDLYAQTFRFEDVNYLSASKGTQAVLKEGYMQLLNSLDPDAMTKITIVSHPLRKSCFGDGVIMPDRGDGRDQYRWECNELILGGNGRGVGKEQDLYITVTSRQRNHADAVDFFADKENLLRDHLKGLGSDCEALDAGKKLQLLQNFYRPEDSDSFAFSLEHGMQKGHDPRDYICPNSLEKYSDYLKIGDRFARVFYLKDYASVMRDRLLSELLASGTNVTVSFDLLPISTEEARREVEQRLLGVETNITNWQRRQNRNNNFSAIVPYDMDLQREETSLILNDLDKNDQSLLLCVLTVLILSDSKEELDRDSKTLQGAAKNRMCQIVPLKYQQLDGLNTVLPIGVRRLECYRTLMSKCASVLVPFRNVDIMDPGGIYYGVNSISRNPILIDRTRLMNQSAMLFGVSGSGKSFLAKLMVTLLILSTQDHIIICDPENEYHKLVGALTDDYAVVHLAVGGKDRLNAVTMVEGYGGNEQDSISTKADFILSLMEQFSSYPFDMKEKSLMDRCLRLVLEGRDPSAPEPTLRDLREKLLEQPEPEAKELALALEIYTIGSLDIFGGASTVDLNKRVLIFDIHDLGENLRPAAMLVMLDNIMNRVTQNWKRGVRTHVFLDEFHLLLQLANTAEYVVKIWRMFRKRNVFPTAITQNAASMLQTEQGRSMVSNSELLVLLNQSQPDQIALGNLLSLSEEQLRCITNARVGCGLIRRGPSLIQFENRFPRNTALYELMTTKPGEGVFGVAKEFYGQENASSAPIKIQVTKQSSERTI